MNNHDMNDQDTHDRGTTTHGRRSTGRWLGLVIGGVAVGAAAIGVVGALDDAPFGGSAGSVPRQTPVNADAPIRTITVTGSGTASAVPDAATISLGVETTAAEANAALDAANEKAQVLLDLLDEFGVESQDIQTSNLSLYPRYDDNGRVITGYTASNQLTVTLRDLDKAGEVLDAAAGFVGNEIRFNGISFFIEDTDEVSSAARADAMDDAKARAEDYATAAGVSLGDVVTISEVAVSSPIPYPMYAADSAGGAESVPIAPGEAEQGVTVTVVYEIAS